MDRQFTPAPGGRRPRLEAAVNDLLGIVLWAILALAMLAAVPYWHR